MYGFISITHLGIINTIMTHSGAPSLGTGSVPTPFGVSRFDTEARGKNAMALFRAPLTMPVYCRLLHAWRTIRIAIGEAAQAPSHDAGVPSPPQAAHCHVEGLAAKRRDRPSLQGS